MPLPKTMKGCMHKVKKEYPDGRAKKKMGKKAAHKQHVAMCLNATEGFTFKSFLLNEMATGAKIELDPMSGDDRAKILDVLRKDKIKFTNQPGQSIIIDMNRNSIAGAALVSHLKRTAEFDDVSDVDPTNWSFKEGLDNFKVWEVSDREVEKFWEYYEDGMSDDEQRELASEEWSDKFTDAQIDSGKFDEFIDHAQEIYSKVHEGLNEGANVDPVMKKLQKFKVKWKKSTNKDGEIQLIATHPNPAEDDMPMMMVYYNPDDPEVVGWAFGEKNKKGNFEASGSGVDDIEDAIDTVKDWIESK